MLPFVPLEDATMDDAVELPFTTATRRILARDLPDLFTATTDGR